jgi:serine/threonine protein kinase/Flp pilus assembly protein TadD
MHTNTAARPAESPSSVLAGLVDDLAARAQAGLPIDLEAVLRKYPEHADELRRLWGALGALHDLSGSGEGNLSGVAPPAGGAAGPDADVLGDFRLLREVGRGGMGVVYEAEQVSLRRRVAVKVLSFAAALDPRQLQRFHVEAQAAALLHHTHIVPVHYVGCERGVHFYAMQFVEGHSLAAVIAKRRELEARKGGQGAPAPSPLDAATVDPAAGAETPPVQGLLSTVRSAGDAAWFRTAAELVAAAAQALDYAHQQGVIHRDVKPANLLVDGRGHLWVADFGLAQVQSDPRLTITGDLIGTLRYMSPEQALAKRVTVDHRTDVYSLGATLYELLTLQPAFAGTDRQELLRQIAFEEPRPPRRLNKAVPPELEVITLKALEKNPAERYATAREIAEDLRRYLEDKPIKARRPTLANRVGKWARRHPELVAASVVLLFLTALGLAVSTLLLSQANDRTWGEWKRAEDNLVATKAEQAKVVKEAAKAKAVTRFLVEDLLGQVTSENVNPERKVKVTLEDLLERAAQRIDGAFPDDQREVEAYIRLTLGKVYRTNLTLPDKSLPHLRRAVELYHQALGPEHEDTLRATGELADLLGIWLNKFEEAEKLAKSNLETCRRVLGPEHPLTLSCLVNLACLFEKAGKTAEAVSLNRQIAEVYLRLHGPCHPTTLFMFRPWSLCLLKQGKLAEAEATARWAVEATHRFVGAEKLIPSSAVHVLSYVLWGQGRWGETERLMSQIVEVRRRAQGPDNGNTVHATHTLAEVLHSQGRVAEAELLYRDSLEKYRSLKLMSRINGPSAMRGLALVLKDLGKLDKAEALALEAMETLREPRPEDHAEGLVVLGAILTAAGKAADAEPLLREGLEIRRNVLPKGHWAVADAESLLGGCLAERKRYADAEPLLKTSYEDLQKDERVPPRVLREAHARLVQLYEAWGKPEEAKAWIAREVLVPDQRILREKWTAAMRLERQKLYRLFRENCPATGEQYNQLAWIMATAYDQELRDPQQAVDLAKQAVEKEPQKHDYWTTLGVAQYRVRDWKASLTSLDQARHLGKEGGGVAFFLAMAYWQTGDKSKARQWYDRAVRWMDQNKPQDEQLRHFRDEAATLLGIMVAPSQKNEAQPAKSSGP